MSRPTIQSACDFMRSFETIEPSALNQMAGSEKFLQMIRKDTAFQICTISSSSFNLAIKQVSSVAKFVHGDRQENLAFCTFRAAKKPVFIEFLARMRRFTEVAQKPLPKQIVIFVQGKLDEADVIELKRISISHGIRMILYCLEGKISHQTIEKMEMGLFQKINSARKEHKLGPLQRSSKLTRCAKTHCKYLAETGHSTHWGEGYSKPTDRVKATGFTGVYIGEMVCGGAGNCSEVVERWVRSSTHAATLLHRRAMYVGAALEFPLRNGNYYNGVPMWVVVVGRTSTFTRIATRFGRQNHSQCE